MTDLNLESFDDRLEGGDAVDPAKANPAGPGQGRCGPALDEQTRLAALHGVPVDIQVVLGHARLPVSQLLKLGRGAVVEIDRKVGEAVDIHINNHLVARGEVVIVDDDKLGITLTEIVGGTAAALS